MDEQNTHNEGSPERGAMPKRAPQKKAIGFIVVLIIILAGAYYFTVYAPKSSTGEEAVSGEISDTAAQQATNEQEILNIVAQAGGHILLPSSEVPVVATVADAEALRAEQPFYANVVNGDHVLIFQEAQRAIIYSPSRDLIVNVGPVVIEDAPAEESLTE